MDVQGSPSTNVNELNEGEWHFRSKLQALWEQEYFVDVTLACEGKFITAHKVILSASSDYFREIFTSITHQYPVVFMRDTTFDVLNALLEYIYCGEVNVSEHNIDAFIKTASALKIKELCVTKDPPTFNQEILRENKLEEKNTRRRNMGNGNNNTELTNIENNFGKRRMENSCEDHTGGKRSKNSTYVDENPEENQIENKHGEKDSLEFKLDKRSRNTKNVDENPEIPPVKKMRQQSFSKKLVEGNEHSTTASNNITSAEKYVHEEVSQRSENENDSIQDSCDGNFDAMNDESNSESEDDGHSETAENNFPLYTETKFQPKKYTAEAMRKAILAVQSGMQLSNASHQHRVPRKTLSNKIRAMQVAVQASPTVMDPEHEGLLLKYIKYMGDICPLTSNQIKMYAWAINTVVGRNKFSDRGPSKNWWLCFCSRNPEVFSHIRDSEVLRANRLPFFSFSFKILADYLLPFQEIIHECNLYDKPSRIWSCSQTTIDIAQPFHQAICSSKIMYKNDIDPTTHKYVSVMIASSANGETMSPYIVFNQSFPKGDYIKNGPNQCMYNKNDTGFINSDSLLPWFEHLFVSQCPEDRSKDNPVVLLLDSNFGYLSSVMIDIAAKENIILASLMPHIPQVCQPLDIAVYRGFRPLLKEKLKLNQELKLVHSTSKEDISSLIKRPFEEAMNSDSIKKGYEVCGIYPFSEYIDEVQYSELIYDINICQTADFKDGASSSDMSGTGVTAASNSGMRKFDANVRVKLEGNIGSSRDNSSSQTYACNKMKIMKPLGRPSMSEPYELNSSSEAEEEEEQDGSCYICGSPFTRDEESNKENSVRCKKKYCKNRSCKECLPLNFTLPSDYICIDCSRQRK